MQDSDKSNACNNSICADMFAGIGRVAHDKNNNYSADRKNDETKGVIFFIRR